ncbi:sarcosine oxidase subunit beta [Rhizobium giardinii]|uniref:Sarcosine oxidase subunit beta n=1 Tax=Rhizobium giardinii TaxID=56731 RepID=A0A7W8X7F7_9HYPH|nr:sarcosine oxidase subunit beta [Rhizobium giardinii]
MAWAEAAFALVAAGGNVALQHDGGNGTGMRYSAFSIVRNALSGNLNWKPAWRQPEPKPFYDVIIVGGGGHGLATAYYLAKEFGLKNIAVLERGYLGSGNVGRNTTIVRSNYMLPGNEPFYEFSMKLWEGLEQDLNYNAMLSQRGVINLYHNDSQRDAYIRRGNAMWMEGVAAELLDRAALKKMLPFLNFDHARFPILGGLLQKRGGTARHDAVACGYARAADRLGVDLIQNCEVTGIHRENGAVTGVDTSKGFIGCGKLGLAVAGNTSQVGQMADLKLPIESHVLQAFVTEGLKRRSITSSPMAPGISTSPSQTRVASSSAARSTVTIPMRSAAIWRRWNM